LSDWTAFDLPLTEQAPLRSRNALTFAEETNTVMLRRHASWFCRLRWIAIAALAALGAAGWASTSFLTVPGFHVDADVPLLASGVLVILNVISIMVLRNSVHSVRSGLWARRILWLQIVIDLVVLTGVVHSIGSMGTFAPYMYLFHIALACIFLSSAQSLGVTLAAMAMYIACLALESSGLVPPTSMLDGLSLIDRGSLPIAVQIWQGGAVVFVSVTVWYLASRLSRALRSREAELSQANRRLKAANEERAAHMLKTTHQMKAPFASIHANSQLLLGGHCGPLPPEAATVVRQIAIRSEMLSRSITAMLQLANLRSSAQDPPPAVLVDVSAIVRSCLVGLAAQAAKRGIAIIEELMPAPIHAVPDHVLMIVDNILSNAVSYSRDGQSVSVSARAQPQGGALVVVRDSGIGIRPDVLPRIFVDYFRAKEAAAFNQASTGLGLAIVRQSAIAGRVGVHVESSPGRGTVFTLDFPGSPETLGRLETDQEVSPWRTY
jgi:two-component system, OmpR family, phosphate regulon sensor histidine kinase PhoR